MKQIVTLQAVLSLALLVCSGQSFAFQESKTISSSPSTSSAQMVARSVRVFQSAIEDLALKKEAEQKTFQSAIEALANQEGAVNKLSGGDVGILQSFLANNMHHAVSRYDVAYQTRVKGAWLIARAIDYFKPCSIVTVEEQNKMKFDIMADLVNTEDVTEPVTEQVKSFCNEHAVEIFDAFVASTKPLKAATPRFGKSWAKLTNRTTIATAATAVATVATALLVYKTGAYKKLSFKATPKRA